MFRTVEVARFFEAWQDLRAAEAVPHYRNLFQGLPNDLIPQVMILEEAPADHYLVRFVGTHFVEMWNDDITERELLALYPPKIAGSLQRNLGAVLAHRCGFHNPSFTIVPARDDLEVEVLLLPATNDQGRPRRLVCFGQEVRASYGLAEAPPTLEERRWIDLGYGIPSRQPK